MAYRIWHIEYRKWKKNKPAPRQVCLHPPHTHTHTPTQSRWTPGPSPETIQPLLSACAFTGCTYNPTGFPVRSQGCTLRQTLNQDVPLNLSPPSWVRCFMLYILQETARISVCARQVRGSILRNFCRLVAYLCRVVSLRQ